MHEICDLGTAACRRYDELVTHFVLSFVGTIDPKPVLSLLLEPWGLVVTTTELYTHLRGIDGITSDVFLPHLYYLG